MAQSDSRERLLLRFVDQVADAAAGLHRFGESLPRSSATKVATVLSELFGINASLRTVHDEGRRRHFGPGFWRIIQDDLVLLFKTLQLTLDEIFAMFARNHVGREQASWEDLLHQMEQLEGCKLQNRLEIYRDFLNTQLAVLESRGSESLRELRQELWDLLDSQETLQRRRRRTSLSGATTPRPGISLPPHRHSVSTPSTSTIISDEWNNFVNVDPRIPIPVPELPTSPLSPQSPTFTSESSQTMSSSQTSYSGGPYMSTTSVPFIHWAQNVFDGSHKRPKRYNGNAQLHAPSACLGQPDPLATQKMERDDFRRVLELPFDEERVWVGLYWRSGDYRARILISVADPLGQRLHYCAPLTTLKAIRQKSCLNLCRAHGEGQFHIWATLNFVFHERLVLFYSTFVAMKRQDIKETHPYLVEYLELGREGDQHEELLFGGMVKDGEMVHALRLFRDVGSGVVRLEACPLRGPRQGVPIWTAFVTHYAYDPDWAHYEGGSVVSFAAIRPAPSVFIAQYAPPQDPSGTYLLRFTTKTDAMEFLDSWTRLCRTHGRRL